jgi:hypothetical protein
VQFSNHTGYPVFKGSHTNREQLQLLVDGLEANGERFLCRGWGVGGGGVGGGDSTLAATCSSPF